MYVPDPVDDPQEEYRKVVIGIDPQPVPEVIYSGIAVEENVEYGYQQQPLLGYPYQPQPLLIPEPEHGEECAEIGCMLSWIPIIGLLNFLLNLDAVPNSRRQYFATMSCYIASFIIVANIIFWFLWTGSSPDDDCINSVRGCR